MTNKYEPVDLEGHIIEFAHSVYPVQSKRYPQADSVERLADFTADLMAEVSHLRAALKDPGIVALLQKLVDG